MQAKSYKTEKLAYALVLAVIFLTAAYFGLVNVSAGRGAVKNNTLFSTTGLVDTLNLVGSRYFDYYGYMVFGNVSYSKLPDYGVGNITGFDGIDVLGDVSLGKSITAFVFKNSSLAFSEFENDSYINSFYGYEVANYSVNISSVSYKGIRLKILSMNMHFPNGINYKKYGVAFYLGNGLFMCSSGNESFCESSSEYLIDKLLYSYKANY